MINVTKTYLPPLEDYIQYLHKIWETACITNNGPLVQELESKLKKYLNVPHIQYVANGTIALQVALKAHKISGKVLTTPFSYVATTTSLLWEQCTPIFVDIEDKHFCIDADKIEAAITPDTKAILAVHVYGYPCDVDKIELLAKKYNLTVIYDAAHTFGVKLNGIPLVNYGDISTISFHATKLFQTAEGGAIMTNNAEIAAAVRLHMSFGHIGDDYYSMGINGKNSELHAAMGLAVMPYIKDHIKYRQEISELYDEGLQDSDLYMPTKIKGLEYNYSYYPVVFKSEQQLLQAKEHLQKNGINPRRYFYPSLNMLPYISGASCPISEDISRRVLCLPLYFGLSQEDTHKIIRYVKDAIR